MARYFGWALAALLFVGAPAVAQPPQQAGAAKSGDHRPGPPKWWMDPGMRAELGITDQQSAAVEAVWQQSVPRMRDLRRKVDEMDTTVSHMIRDAVDEPTIVAQLDRVESVRAELNKARVLMLYRMNRVLSPDQRTKLKALWERQHGGDRRHP